jgi:hypothetical protein
MNHPDHGICIVVVYVHDIIVIFNSPVWISSAKARISQQLNMTDFGGATSIMGMGITYDLLGGTPRVRVP